MEALGAPPVPDSPAPGTRHGGRTRRRILTAVVVGGALVTSSGGTSAARTAGDGSSPAFVPGCPLVEPPVLAPKDLGKPRKHALNVNVTAEPATVNVGGALVRTDVYNASSTVHVDRRCAAGGRLWIPPTLRVDPGDDLNIQYANNQTDTNFDSNLHFHGLHVTPGFVKSGDTSVAGDNVFVDVPVGGAQRYSLDIPADHPVGTYWYHGHIMPEEPQMMAGEAGLVQIGDVTSQLPPALRGITSHTMMLKDMQFKPNSNHVVTSDILSDDPAVRLVNNMLQPTLGMAVNETQHWTFANTSADIYYDMQFDGHTFAVVGEDGNPVWHVRQESHLLMPPAKRFDVLVQSTGGERIGSTATLRTLAYNQGTDGDVYPDVAMATVAFTPPRQSHTAALPIGMPGARPVSGVVTNRETVYFNQDDAGFAISTLPGVPHSQSPLPFTVQVPRGADEVTGEWTVANTTQENHVFHMHINPLQIVAASDPGAACPNALKPVTAAGLIDTFNLPQARTTATAVQCAGDPAPTTTHYGRVVFRTTWRDFFGAYVGDPAGRIMIHCHIEAHMDNGMMTWFEVVKQ